MGCLGLGGNFFAVDSGDFGRYPIQWSPWDQKRWQSRLAGRCVEAVQLAAVALGQDINNPSDLNAIREKLRALKPQIRAFGPQKMSGISSSLPMNLT